VIAPRHLVRAVFAAFALLVALAAYAGRSCEEKPPTPESIARGLALALQTRDALEATGADVVLLARAGQDLREYGLHWSHLGFAYRERDAQGASAWRIVHKLNRCGSADAALYRQGLGDFFLDDPWRYEAAWVVPSREVQDRLLALLRDDTRVAIVHARPYSVVSYAWGQRYQQSNQWAIETLAVAMQPQAVADRAQAQAWLAAQGYRPATLRIDALTRLAGRLTRANVAFDDHPPGQRFTDRIETVSVESVFDLMARRPWGGPVSTISVEAGALK
jgi:hypothetical protein